MCLICLRSGNRTSPGIYRRNDCFTVVRAVSSPMKAMVPRRTRSAIRVQRSLQSRTVSVGTSYLAGLSQQ
jgi:hypothetical protein